MGVGRRWWWGGKYKRRGVGVGRGWGGWVGGWGGFLWLNCKIHDFHFMFLTDTDPIFKTDVKDFRHASFAFSDLCVCCRISSF